MPDKETIINLLPGQILDIRTPRGMRVTYPSGKTNPPRIITRDLGTWVEPPPPPPVEPPPSTKPWPTSTPWGQEPHTPAPPIPAGLAAGTMTLQQAVDATPAGGVLNASISGKVWREKVTISKPITIVGYGAEVRGDTAKVEEWFLVFSSDVTIEGFRCTNSGVGQSMSNQGGIQLGGYGNTGRTYDRLTLRNLDLDGRAGAPYRGDLVCIQGNGTGHKFVGNRMASGGRSAITGSGMALLTIARNEFGDNTTGAGTLIDVGIDGGAVKLLFTDGITFEDNRVVGNRGRGLWTDTQAKNVLLRGNDLSGNAYNGAFLESSHGLTVVENLVERNARADAAHPWLWGGGICLASSDHATVTKNLVIDNGSGITVVSQDRTDDAPHVDLNITDNDVLMDNAGWYAIGWAQDWAGQLFLPTSQNRGSNNRVHGSQRFAWDGDKGLAAFNATPAGGGSTRMLTDAEAAALRA